jgi:hypothetical protein
LSLTPIASTWAPHLVQWPWMVLAKSFIFSRLFLFSDMNSYRIPADIIEKQFNLCLFSCFSTISSLPCIAVCFTDLVMWSSFQFTSEGMLVSLRKMGVIRNMNIFAVFEWWWHYDKFNMGAQLIECTEDEQQFAAWFLLSEIAKISEIYGIWHFGVVISVGPKTILRIHGSFKEDRMRLVDDGH